MIEIIIDYNNDEVRGYKNEKEIFKIKIAGNMSQIQTLVYEILNLMGMEDNKNYVRLSKIDEDTETTIDEW
jgi:hypothetical protein